MSHKLPNMLDSTISKIREMVDVNSVVGEAITTPDGVTIIPITRVSIGFGGGGSDFVSKNVNKQDYYTVVVLKNTDLQLVRYLLMLLTNSDVLKS